LQLIDRLVSASSPSDAIDSLTALTSSINAIRNDNDDSSSSSSSSLSKEEHLLATLEILANNTDFMMALCSLLSENIIKKEGSNSGSGISGTVRTSMSVEEGDTAGCQFLVAVVSSLEKIFPNNSNSTKGKGGSMSMSMNMSSSMSMSSSVGMNRRGIAALKKFLSESKSKNAGNSDGEGGRLTHALLDILSPGIINNTSSDTTSTSNSTSTSIYAKTQALQLLAQFATLLPTLLHSQILSAPDGLHRILDLLSSGSNVNDNDNTGTSMGMGMEESIRNEAILLCTTLARTNAGSARLLIFGEAYDKVFDIANSEFRAGAGAGSMAVVGDCLKLAVEMTRQDSMGSEVFLGNKVLIDILVGFLDLRSGSLFRNPVVQQVVNMEEDDLDDILNDDDDSKKEDTKKEEDVHPVPYLTEEESGVTLLALELIRVLVLGDGSESDSNSNSESDSDESDKKKSRQASILSHTHLQNLLIDMGLYTLPPPSSPFSAYVSAVPTLAVQLSALDVISTLTHNCDTTGTYQLQETILQNGILDRLNYMVCTGDGIGNRDADAADEISMYSLGVLRCLLSEQKASVMMMHTLAPPPPPDPEDDDDGTGTPVPVDGEVQKLVHTLAENLQVLVTPSIVSTLSDTIICRMHRMVMGSAGALGIFLTNGAGATTREMLLRVPVPPSPSGETETVSLVECMLIFLEHCSNDVEFLNKGSTRNVAICVLRLLCEWIVDTPLVVHAILSSASSMSLGVLVQQNYDRTSDTPPTVQAFSAILLGLCMTGLKPEEEIGGWSIGTIMNLINVGLGIGKFTQLLESLKVYLDKDNASASGKGGIGIGPWACCNTERARLSMWYTGCVNTVRRRAIEQLTIHSNGDTSESDDDEDDNGNGNGNDSSSRDKKSMRKLVAQQSSELEKLNVTLTEITHENSVHTSHIQTLKKRLESTPSQLEDMLEEYTAKVMELEAKQNQLELDSNKKVQEMETDMQKQKADSDHVQKQLEMARHEISSAQNETKQVQEEMTGLTAAYVNLEGEYNRVAQSNANGNGTGAPNGNGQSNGDATSEGNGVMPMSSYNILKEENMKLRADTRKANEWMTKAVSKMDGMGKKTKVLESELELVKQANQQVQRVMTNEREQAKEVRDQLNEVRQERDELQNTIITLRDAPVPDPAPRPIVSSEEVAKLNYQINNLNTDLTKEQTRHENIVSELQNNLQDKEAQITDLQWQITSISTSVEANKQVSNNDDNANSIKLQAEIKKLTAANKSAQDWMSNAVKHIAALKNQLKESNSKLKMDAQIHDENLLVDVNNTLTRERDEALRRAVDLEVKLSELSLSLDHEKSINGANNKAAQDTTTSEVEAVKAQLECQLESSIHDIKALKDQITTFEKALAQERTAHITAQEANSSLKASLDEKEMEYSILQAESTRLQTEAETSISERQDQYTTISKLQSDLEMVTEENTTHEGMIESMRTRLTEFQSWTETAQTRIGELESEKEIAEHRVEELEASMGEYDEGQRQMIEMKNSMEELEELKTQSEGDKMEMNKARSELAAVSLRIVDLEAERHAVESRLEERDIQYQELKEQHHATTTSLQQVQEEATALQLQNSTAAATSASHEAEIQTLRKEIYELQIEIGDYDAKNRDLEQEKKMLETANHDLSHKGDLLDDVEENLFEKEQEVADLKSALKKSKDSLEELQKQSEDAIQQWRKKNLELEEETNKLESEIAQQTEGATSAISQWEERCHTLESDIARMYEQVATISGLEIQIQSLTEQAAAQTSILEDVNANMEVEKKNVQTLMEEKSEAEAVFQNHIQELEMAIQKHVTANEELHSQLDEKEYLVEKTQEQVEMLTQELEETNTQSEEVVTQWQANGQQLEETVEELEMTIERQSEEATAAIQQWEERCNALTEQVAHLESDEVFQAMESLQQQSLVRETDMNALQVEKNDMVEKKRVLMETVIQMQEDRTALDGLLTSEKDNHAATHQAMQAAVLELDHHKLQLAEQRALLEAEVAAKSALQMELQELQTTQAELTRGLEERQEIMDDYQRQKETLAANLLHAEEENSRLQEAIEGAEQDINELKLIIGQLEVELHEANDALQLHLTDEVTIRATEKAVGALRAQIKDMREKQGFDNHALVSERNERINAEEEIERLKADLALLAKIESLNVDGDDLDGLGHHVQKMTSKASAEIMQKEREEIDSLRRSLDEMIEELKSSAFREREAENRSANSRMHASVCEQELQASKADVNFLRQTLRDATKDHSNMQGLLQQRIHTLEVDRQNLVDCNKAENEAVKTELSSAIFERDQLIHALNESEMANSTLVYSTTIESDKENNEDAEVEMSKLRLENAQLLSEASKSASRLERRIKNALSGDASIVEAEIDAEKRRFEDAEKALSTLKETHEKVLKDLEDIRMVNSELSVKIKAANTSNLKEELEKAQSNYAAAEREKLDLVSKLTQSEASAKINVATLEEKCRASEAKIREIERAEHKEAVMAAEISKLREENSKISSEIAVEPTMDEPDDFNSSSEGKGGEEMVPIDCIKELQTEIGQERDMYSELLGEHEDLLALLAQMDCEKKYLSAALEEVKGKDVVERIINEAEEKIVEQAGNYVR